MKKLPRVIVLGLDGTPHTLIKSYVDKGLMPNLKSIIAQGSIHQMNTVLPEVSAVAWTSFMTGKNPAKTNIYGFFDMKVNSYQYQFTSFLSLKQPPIWNLIHKELRKPSIIINMPSAYPVQAMNGVLISGFVSPVFSKSVYPKSLLPVLEEMNYLIDLDLKKIGDNKELLLKEASKMLEKREQTLDLLWGKVDWQFLSCIITGTDRLHHFLMDSFENDHHPLNSAFEEYYKKVDSFIGRLNSRLRPDDIFILLSDHGFEVTKYEVSLNALFKQKGWLEDLNGDGKFLENITQRTSVFALDPARIYINRSNRYPDGIEMNDNDYNTLLNQIKSELEGLLSPSGDKVVKTIHLKEEIYSGQYIDNAPDLILVANAGYSFKGTTDKENVFVLPSKHTGHHNAHDAFLICNYKMLPDRKPIILDLVPTILTEMQIDIANYDFDGKPIAIST